MSRDLHGTFEMMRAIRATQEETKMEKLENVTEARHEFVVDDDRCRCGGEWVWFDGTGTHGCEVAGPYMAKARNIEGLDGGQPLDNRGCASCDDCGATGPLDIDWDVDEEDVEAGEVAPWVFCANGCEEDL